MVLTTGVWNIIRNFVSLAIQLAMSELHQYNQLTH